MYWDKCQQGKVGRERGEEREALAHSAGEKEEGDKFE